MDLRHEPILSGHEQLTRAGESRLQDLRDGTLLRDGPWLSENARSLYQELIGVDWTKRLSLADVIERGAAKETEAEHDTLYESYPDILDAVIDLFNMVSRRDEAIATLRAERDDAADEARFYD